MRSALLAPAAALVVLIATAPAVAQFAGKPIYPRVGAPFMTLPTQPKPTELSSFATFRDFCAQIAKRRGLPDPDSDLAVQQIESRSTIEQLRDYSGEEITVVKLEATRAGDDASFFVLRQKEGHLRLLGEMKGRGYEASTASGHLEFVLDVGQPVAQALRYQVDGDFLINLADLAGLDRNDPVELDVRNGF